MTYRKDLTNDTLLSLGRWPSFFINAAEQHIIIADLVSLINRQTASIFINLWKRIV